MSEMRVLDISGEVERAERWRRLPPEMVHIPGGSFWMGSAQREEGGWSAERPQHRVRVSGFEMMTTAVSQWQYWRLMGVNPSHSSKEADWESRPVETVSWYEALRFSNAMSEREGLEPVYREVHQDKWSRVKGARGYRLPTEAEWEYACRAGTQTRWSFGDDEKRLSEHAWFDGNSGNQSHPVGSKKANSWGLYDMHGGVWEWCWDAWQDPLPSRAQINPEHLSGSLRVVRGGSWGFYAGLTRAGCRRGITPSSRWGSGGLRLVR